MSTSTLTMTDQSPPPILLTRVLRLLGHLTSPETLTGKVFTRCEQTMTGAMAKLATSDRYLRVAGKGLEMSFRMRKNMIDIAEEMLHMARIPAVSEVNELRNQVRVMHDQMEATQSQLEIALDLLERIDARIAENASTGASAQTGEG